MLKRIGITRKNEHYRALDNEYKRKIAVEKNKQLKEIIDKNTDNPWNVINKIIKTNNNNEDEDHCYWLTTEKYQKDCEQKMSTLSNTPAKLTTKYINNNQYRLEKHIDREDLIKTLSSVKNVAAGIEEVKSNLLKILMKKNIDYFTLLYNQIISSQHFPTPWKIGRGVMIPKASGDKARLIHVQCFYGKILEKIISKQLINQTPEDIWQHQFAYQTGKSRDDAIETLTEHLPERYSNKKVVAGLFAVDVKGAFDNISRTAILETIETFNLHENYKQLIKSFLTERHTVITYLGRKGWREEKDGVPQGSVLGPILYIIGSSRPIQRAINSIERSGLTNIQPAIYADDISFIVTAWSRKKMEQVSKQVLTNLNENLKSIKLELEPRKTQFMMLKGYNKNGSKVTLDELQLTERDNIKILGYMFGKNNQKIHHWNYIKSKIKSIYDNVALNQNRLAKLPDKWKKLIIYSFVYSQIGGLPKSTFQDLTVKTYRELALRLTSKVIKKIWHQNPSLANITSLAIAKIEPPWEFILRIITKQAEKSEATKTKLLSFVNQHQNATTQEQNITSVEKQLAEISSKWIEEYSNGLDWVDSNRSEIFSIVKKFGRRYMSSWKALSFMAGSYYYLSQDENGDKEECWCKNELKTPSHWILSCPITEETRLRHFGKHLLSKEDIKQLIKKQGREAKPLETYIWN
ncbi:uncharacterized protein LOC107370949, partial [Tetranychus urticae]|uniref:uncharacterized protein LOC107370949 n=1 Tax=Tetranychus urticae TaxID=32264 RepID=UPI00077B98E2